MKQKIITIVMSVITLIVLAAVGISAINGVVTIENKESSFKLTEFDYVIKSPLRSQIDELEANTEAVASTFPCTELRAIVTSAATSPELILLAAEDMTNYSIGLFCDATLVDGAFDSTGIMLDETAAGKLQVSVGDEVSFSAKGMPVVLKVAAIYRASTYKTLEKGIGLIHLTDDMKAAYGRELPHSICFIDAEDEVKCGAALANYKPHAQLKTEEQFTVDYNERYDRRPGVSDDEWAEIVHNAYVDYFTEGSALLTTDGSVERKSEMMEDIADRVATTRNDVDALTVGIAIASAIVYSVLCVVVMFTGTKDDVLRAKQGTKKAHIVRERTTLGVGGAVLVAIASLGVLAGYASAKGYVEPAMPAILLCSLPVLVAVPVSVIAAQKYGNTVFGKIKESEDGGAFMGTVDLAEFAGRAPEGEISFGPTFVRTVPAQDGAADATTHTRPAPAFGDSERTEAAGGTDAADNGATAEGGERATVSDAADSETEANSAERANTDATEAADADATAAEGESAEACEDNTPEAEAAEDEDAKASEAAEGAAEQPRHVTLDIGIDYIPPRSKRNITVTTDDVGDSDIG